MLKDGNINALEFWSLQSSVDFHLNLVVKHDDYNCEERENNMLRLCLLHLLYVGSIKFLVADIRSSSTNSS